MYRVLREILTTDSEYPATESSYNGIMFLSLRSTETGKTQYYNTIEEAEERIVEQRALDQEYRQYRAIKKQGETQG